VRFNLLVRKIHHQMSTGVSVCCVLSTVHLLTLMVGILNVCNNNELVSICVNIKELSKVCVYYRDTPYNKIILVT
jgi:hypothetical protein